MLDLRFNNPESYKAEQFMPKRFRQTVKDPTKLLHEIFPDFDFLYDNTKGMVIILQAPFAIFTEKYSNDQIITGMHINTFRVCYKEALDYLPYPSLDDRRGALDSLGFTLDGFNALSMIQFVLAFGTAQGSGGFCLDRGMQIRKRMSKYKYKFSYVPTSDGGIFPVTLDAQELAIHGQEIVDELIANGGKMYNEIQKIAFTELPINLIGE